MPNLTKTTVEAAQPHPMKDQTFVWDDSLPGFGLRITRAGVKSYVIEYRANGSTQSRRKTIGRHGKVTPDQARKLAKGLFADITHGKDPVAEDQAAKAETTVGKLLDQFIAEHVKVNNKPSTASREERLINGRIRPALGSLKVSALTTARVREFHSSMVGTKISGNRALAHLRRACRFGIEHGMLKTNPCDGITRYKETPKDRFFTDQELQAIGRALRDLEAAGGLFPGMGDAIRLLALTGLRLGEVQTLSWSNFDASMGVLRLMDAKTGARPVVLCEQAISLLTTMERRGKFMFPGSDPEGPISPRAFSHAVEVVLARAKVTGCSAHTFRHTVATYMAQHGDSVFMIAQAGGWRTLAMVQRYVNLYAAGKPHPLKAGDRIWTALTAEPQQASFDTAKAMEETV